MLIQELLAMLESQDYSKMPIKQLAQVVRDAIDKFDSSFMPRFDIKNNDSEYNGADTAHFEVTSEGKIQQLSKAIDPFYRAFRDQGLTFTQPQGVTGKSNAVEFVIGVPKK